VTNSIIDSKSFYTSISFGYAKRRFKNITPKGIQFAGDTMTDVILSLIIKDKIQ